MHLPAAAVSSEDASFPTSGKAADPTSPPRDDSCIQSASVAAWRPRVGAGHLSKGPAGVWYMRLAIPARVRQLNPGLPGELKRSTLVTHKRLALARARKMCSEFVASLTLPEGEKMLANGSTNQSRFNIEYIDGRIQTAFSPDPADADIMVVFSRIQSMVMAQMAGRASRSLQASPAMIAQPAEVLTTFALPSSPALAQSSPLASLAIAIEAVDTAATNAGAPIWLSDAIEAWRTGDGRNFSDKTWRKSYAPTFRNTRRDITTAEGQTIANQLDRRLATLTRKDIEDLYSKLKEYPARQGKRRDGIEAPQRIAEAKASNAPLQTPGNVKKLLDHCAPFFRHLKAKEWVQVDLDAEIGLQLGAAFRRQIDTAEATGDDDAGYVSLTTEDLRSTYEQPSFLELVAEHEWATWIDPIRLFCGARVSEVCQLYLEDIVTIDGHPCFSFVRDPTDEATSKRTGEQSPPRPKTQLEARRLKTKSSRRIVPIHPRLIALGFLDFVEYRKAQETRGDVLPFKHLRWEEASSYGRKPSETTLELLKTAGVWQKHVKVGHSLRSSFQQALEDQGLRGEFIDRLLGHAPTSMRGKAYGRKKVEAVKAPIRTLPLAKVVEVMAKVDFDVKFPTWQEAKSLQTEYARRCQAERRVRAQARRGRS